MKVKVVKQFIDKNTKNLHKVNKILTLSKERYEEINYTAHGIFVEEIKEEKKPTNKKKK